MVLARLFLILALLAVGTAARAQAPPAPLTPQQFDALVEAITQAVSQRLNARLPAAPVAEAKPAEAKSAEAKPAAGEPPMMIMGDEEPAAQVVIGLIDRAGETLAAEPELMRQYGRIPSFLHARMNEGRAFSRFLGLLVLAAAIALGSEALLRRLLDPMRRRVTARLNGAAGLWVLAGLAALDALLVAVMWVVTYGFVVVWFPGMVPQSRLAYLVLSSLVYWRLYMLVFRIVLRPGLSVARLADIDDADAAAIYWRVSALVLLTLLTSGLHRILVGIQAPPQAVACGILIDSVLVTAAFVWAASSVRGPMSRWLRGLSNAGQPGPVQAALAKSWLVVAIPFFVALGLANIYGALVNRAGTHEALVTTLNVVIALLLLESLLDKASRLLGRDLDRTEACPRAPAVEAVVRCVRMAIIIGAGVLLMRVWSVSALGMMDMNRYHSLALSALTAGLTLFAAYCVWQAVQYFTAAYSANHRSGMPGGHDAEDAANAGGSRIATLMPLLRVAILVALVVLAGLTALSQLGVNITPLIAGASIVGLAVSFGSQTLVKDIVSGVFYLVDDAFRVGEYIDCGKAKGTVEGFTLRSLKLRHQNGQIHTIPFGQLGQITNFSRDWSTMKFNLRFSRDTDIEKLRKAVKKIGQDMLEDPELKDEFLVPLKMQGVADVADNALIVRFKFTVKPSRPTLVQREAIKRMIRTLPDAGIEFANATVAVQSLGGPNDYAAAAANSVRARAAEAQAAAAAQAEAEG
ncbi:MAG TPA: mechanosensitive ion channel family protein [Xanthobacteraceae bacterium]|nr:mechanosensitive ion channel family protein [Xanthobacteraceae bacterium]